MGNSKDNKDGSPMSNPSLHTKTSPQQAESAAHKQDETVKLESTNKSEPLSHAPPSSLEPAQTPDYFGVAHAGFNLSTEDNVFESSFAAGGQSSANGTGDQTPGGTKLPGVAAIGTAGGLLGPWGSLRAGPLSPAMLSAPQKDDYFSEAHHLRSNYPTPNESSMRTGLTPGGGGSMFPDPSPQGLFGLPGGVATPSTVEFHRTALNAAAHNRIHQGQSSITSQPQDMNIMDARSAPSGQFEGAGNDANDAANGLFLLAQARNNAHQTNHFTTAPSMTMTVHSHPLPVLGMGGNSIELSPVMDNRNHGSISTTSGRGASVMSEENEPQNRPNTRGKGKRSHTQIPQPNGRKANETPSKAPTNKRSKGNNGRSSAVEPEPPSEDEEEDNGKDEYNANGKKATEEDKRKNFLERNRVAALKCRQRKKQWLQNLQQKVEIYTAENDTLANTVSALREELQTMKNLLAQHKDCPVSVQQGLSQQVMSMDGFSQHMNHPSFGMAVGAQGIMNGSGVHGMPEQRRYQ